MAYNLINENDIFFCYEEKVQLMAYDKENGLKLIPKLKRVVAEAINVDANILKIINELCINHQYHFDNEITIRLLLRILNQINESIVNNADVDKVVSSNPNFESLIICVNSVLWRAINHIISKKLLEYVNTKHPELHDISGIKDYTEADFIMSKCEEFYETSTIDAFPSAPLIDNEGRLIIKKGDLYHGVSFSYETVASIAQKGLESGQLHGIAEDGETFWCIDFFKVSSEGTSIDDMCKFGKRYTNSPNSVVFIINKNDLVGEEAMFPSLSLYDAYDESTEFGKIARDFVNTKELPLNSSTGAAILIGLPPSMISSIVVNEKIETDEEKVAFLNVRFPKAYIFSRKTGTILKRPIEDKSVRTI